MASLSCHIFIFVLLVETIQMDPPTDATGSSPAAPTSINLFRRDGVPRLRFSEAERRRLLGGHEDDLDAFCELFVPRRFPYILQRQKEGERQRWRTVRHAITKDLIVRHLLANRLPGVEPIWIGALAWERTRFVAIDVDFRGDAEDFIQRCKKS